MFRPGAGCCAEPLDPLTTSSQAGCLVHCVDGSSQRWPLSVAAGTLAHRQTHSCAYHNQVAGRLVPRTVVSGKDLLLSRGPGPGWPRTILRQKPYRALRANRYWPPGGPRYFNRNWWWLRLQGHQIGTVGLLHLVGYIASGLRRLDDQSRTLAPIRFETWGRWAARTVKTTMGVGRPWAIVARCFDVTGKTLRCADRPSGEAAEQVDLCWAGSGWNVCSMHVIGEDGGLRERVTMSRSGDGWVVWFSLGGCARAAP